MADWVVGEVPEDYSGPVLSSGGGVVGWYTPGAERPTSDSLPMVGGVIPQPRRYATRHGFEEMPEDPTWPNPRWVSVAGGEMWYEDTMPWQDGSTRWGMSHWTLHPRTRLGLIVARIIQGRAVEYPWRHVLWFAWHYRKWCPKAP